jgi:hypothetical protein
LTRGIIEGGGVNSKQFIKRALDVDGKGTSNALGTGNLHEYDKPNSMMQHLTPMPKETLGDKANRWIKKEYTGPFEGSFSSKPHRGNEPVYNYHIPPKADYILDTADIKAQDYGSRSRAIWEAKAADEYARKNGLSWAGRNTEMAEGSTVPVTMTENGSAFYDRDIGSISLPHSEVLERSRHNNNVANNPWLNPFGGFVPGERFTGRTSGLLRHELAHHKYGPIHNDRYNKALDIHDVEHADVDYLSLERKVYPEFSVAELAPALDATQTEAFRTTGSRITTPEQYYNWVNTVDPNDTSISREARRWINYRNTIKNDDTDTEENKAKRLKWLDDNAIRMLPGMARNGNTGNIGKYASVNSKQFIKYALVDNNNYLDNLLSRAELVGSRGRARMYGRPEPEDRDYDYVIFSDDKEDVADIRDKLKKIIASQQGYQSRDRGNGYITATSEDTDISVAPVSRRDEILKAWSLIESGVPKSEAWGIVNAMSSKDLVKRAVLNTNRNVVSGVSGSADTNTWDRDTTSISQGRNRLLPAKLRNNIRLLRGMWRDVRGKPAPHLAALNRNSKTDSNTSAQGHSPWLYNLAVNPGGNSHSIHDKMNSTALGFLDPHLHARATNGTIGNYGVRDRFLDAVHAPAQIALQGLVGSGMARGVGWGLKNIAFNPMLAKGLLKPVNMAAQKYLPAGASKLVSKGTGLLPKALNWSSKAPGVRNAAAGALALHTGVSQSAQDAGVPVGDAYKSLGWAANRGGKILSDVSRSNPEFSGGVRNLLPFAPHLLYNAVDARNRLNEWDSATRDYREDRLGTAAVNIANRINNTAGGSNAWNNLTKSWGRKDLLFPGNKVINDIAGPAITGVRPVVEPINKFFINQFGPRALANTPRPDIRRLGEAVVPSLYKHLGPSNEEAEQHVNTLARLFGREAGKKLDTNFYTDRFIPSVVADNLVADRSRAYGDFADNLNKGDVPLAIDQITSGEFKDEQNLLGKLISIINAKRSADS